MTRKDFLLGACAAASSMAISSPIKSILGGRSNANAIEELIPSASGYIQEGLAKNLGWLNYAFGKAERLVKDYKGKRVYSPNLYVGKNEYELITPDSNIGNYCFFVLDEPGKPSGHGRHCCQNRYACSTVPPSTAPLRSCIV